jgi:hypothetical protein
MLKSVQIQVPKPCHENWNNMTPKEQGRFCGSCQKIVVDFSKMSDKELLDHISRTAGQSTCGRFTNEQLNRNIKATEKKRRYSWAYIWNLLLATFLVTESYAQEQPVATQKSDVQLPNLSPAKATFALKERDTIASKEISGIIIDKDTKEPIAGATIMVKGSNKGTVADSLGRFKLMVDDKSTITLEVSCVGYETQTVKINKKKDWQNVKMTMKGAIMGEIAYTSKENKPD